MIQMSDCVNLIVLKEFPIIHIPELHFPLGPCAFSPSLPPDYPLYWAKWYPQEDSIVMKDDDGAYHLIPDAFAAWKLRKPLPLDHCAVQEFIARMKKDNEGTFVHPEHGVFRLDFFNNELVEYIATDKDNPDKIVMPPTKEELEPYATEENGYYLQLVRRYYPDYQP